LEKNKGSYGLTEEYIPNLVSVIIPTYNREAYLLEAVMSVIGQNYRPIECIIVDDGSTDNTKMQVDKMAKASDKNFTIKYIHQANSGSQVARNTGTKASKGEFIQYLDSDDLLYPEKIQKQVDYLKNNVDCDGVWGGWAKGTVEKNEIIISLARRDLLTQFLTEHCIHTLAFLFRRSIVEKIGEWDIAIKRNQEIDFQIRGVLEGANFQYQAQISGLWRIHEGERIASTTGLKEFFDFYQKWEKILVGKGLFNEEMKKNIASIYFWLIKNNKGNKEDNMNLLREVLRLNPQIPYIQTKKMRFLKKIFGLNKALKFWLNWI
jgi:glycosyltransferase involved in cell wall biosynthesis